MIKEWFEKDASYFNEFVHAMFHGNVDEMNLYMNDVALKTFSYFDTGGGTSDGKDPERFSAGKAITSNPKEQDSCACFYHGFVLGLLVDNAKNYMLKSNRESGYGRYDVVMEPKNADDVAVIIEFKVLNERHGEKSLEDTVKHALQQIEDKKYETALLQRGISKQNILKYGFAFYGEKCLIGKV